MKMMKVSDLTPEEFKIFKELIQEELKSGLSRLSQKIDKDNLPEGIVICELDPRCYLPWPHHPSEYNPLYGEVLHKRHQDMLRKARRFAKKSTKR